MKLRTGIALAGIGLISAGAALAAYVLVTDENIKNKTKESLDEFVASARHVAEKMKADAEDTARKAQRVAENNMKWSEAQWEKLTHKE